MYHCLLRQISSEIAGYENSTLLNFDTYFSDCLAEALYQFTSSVVLRNSASFPTPSPVLSIKIFQIFITQAKHRPNKQTNKNNISVFTLPLPRGRERISHQNYLRKVI